VAQVDKKPKAVVTGINGFTGKYVADELRRIGFEVHGTAYKNEATNRQIARVDLTNTEEVSNFIQFVNPSVVVHLAAVSFVANENISEMYDVNIVGTRNLFQSLTTFGSNLKSLVVSSSGLIYGNSNVQPLSEGCLPAPTNDYAVSKFAMEKMANLWIDKLPITIVRPFNYTGRGQPTNFLVPKLVHHFKTRLPEIELGNLEVYRDYSDVRTVAWAYGQLALKPTSGEIFNICSGKSIPLRTVLDKLVHLTGHNIRIKSDWSLVRAGEINALVGDASKLWAYIGKPDPISFDETLSWMVAD
jgi:nucleoside-diphosphate-sugar epimerase